MTSKQTALLSLRNVYAGYESEMILQDVSLDIFEGDYIGLIGPNGGGKTTLLKVILGLLSPRSGQVRILGQEPERGRQFIGYVPQFVDTDHDFPISVWDTVRMGLMSGFRPFWRLSAREAGRMEVALNQVGMLDQRKRAMGELSGGQRQRVFIARALVSEPKLLLLDEPTASVDPNVTSEIYELFNELNAQTAILLVTHDMMAVSSHTKTIACLNRKLVYHHSKELTADLLDSLYGCPVDLIAHGVPHRVLLSHEKVSNG